MKERACEENNPQRKGHYECPVIQHARVVNDTDVLTTSLIKVKGISAGYSQDGGNAFDEATPENTLGGEW